MRIHKDLRQPAFLFLLSLAQLVSPDRFLARAEAQAQSQDQAQEQAQSQNQGKDHVKEKAAGSETKTQVLQKANKASQETKKDEAKQDQKQEEKSWEEYLADSKKAFAAGKLSDSEELADAALSSADRLKTDGSRADACFGLAEQYLHLEQFERAKALMEEGLKLRKGRGISNANALDNLAQAYARTGDLPGASEKEQEALKIYESLQKTDSQDYAIALANHANTLRQLKKYKDSEQFFARAVKVQQKVDVAAGKPDGEELARILLNAVGLYCETDKLDSAKRLLDRAKKIIQAKFSPEHPLYKLSIKSERVYVKKRVDALLKHNSDPLRPQVAESVSRLAELYEAEGDYSLASAAYKEALAIQKKLLAPGAAEIGKLETSYTQALSKISH